MAKQDFFAYIRQFLDSDEEFSRFVDALPKPLTRTVKVLWSRVDIPSFVQMMHTQWTQLSPTIFRDFVDMFYVQRDSSSLALWKTFSHLLGWFYMQELAASIPPHVVDLPENWVVLDMSAAPGGKTIQMADYILQNNHTSLVWANDLDAKRLPVLENNIDRTGMYNTCTTKYNGSIFGQSHREFFDSVLLDAPCSGEGTWFKSDDAYAWWKLQGIQRIARTQYDLLVSALFACKPGGSVVYSTCTLNPVENEDILQKIWEEFGDHIYIEHIDVVGAERWLSSYSFAQDIVRCWPHKQYTGWFFVSKIRKKDSFVWSQIFLQPKPSPIIVRNPGYFDVGRDIQDMVCRYLVDVWGIVVDRNHYLFVRTPHHICVTSPLYMSAIGTAEFNRVGVPIVKLWSRVGDFRPLHQLGIILGTQATTNVLTLTQEQVQKYVLGEDFLCDTSLTWFVILQFAGRGVGVGKVVNGMLKNKFMKIL